MTRYADSFVIAILRHVPARPHLLYLFNFVETPRKLIKDCSTLGVHYRDLQARVHEQETRNLTLHEAQPNAVLNFEFLVRERVLVNPMMHEQRVLKTF